MELAGMQQGAGAAPVSARPSSARVTPAVAHRPAATRGDRTRSGLRLTARGRVVAVVLAASGAFGLGAVAGAVPRGRPDTRELRLAGDSSVVVESGDTLWSIATAVAGDGDVRPVVDGLRVLNDLDSSRILPGQVLRLP